MHKVNRSKEPSVRQMLNMAENLREKYNVFVTVEASGKAHCTSWISLYKFTIYMSDRGHEESKTWKECQDKYFELVK